MPGSWVCDPDILIPTDGTDNGTAACIDVAAGEVVR